jgi:hypothetical protein
MANNYGVIGPVPVSCEPKGKRHSAMGIDISKSIAGFLYDWLIHKEIDWLILLLCRSLVINFIYT